MNSGTVKEMLDRILKTIASHKLVEDGDSVIAAVSGGPDSVCLLHALHALSARLNIKLLAVHINHRLRGAESEADEAYTRELCNKLGIYLHCRAFDILEISRNEGISLEEAGREARYREFELFADAAGAAKIAVAHNKNDQAETVLMNIIRGTGLAGLAGMEYKRGRIIRPLLDVPRCEIERYCAENLLSPEPTAPTSRGILPGTGSGLSSYPQ